MKECDNVTSQRKLKPSNGGYTEQETPPNRGKNEIFIINKLPSNQGLCREYFSEVVKKLSKDITENSCNISSQAPTAEKI